MFTRSRHQGKHHKGYLINNLLQQVRVTLVSPLKTRKRSAKADNSTSPSFVKRF